MITRGLNLRPIFHLSLCFTLLFLISCNRTTTTTSTNNSEGSTQTTSTLETSNNDEVTEWLMPLISNYLQDDSPTTFRLITLKNGNGSGSISSSPNGINCGATCTVDYDDATTVTLTATADAGSSFTSWTGCDSVSANICTVTVTSIQYVTTTFASQLTYQGFYMTQAAQNFNNTAALVENRKSYARLFLTQSGTDHNAINADLHMYSGTNYLGKVDLVGPPDAPANYSEGDLTSSYNAEVPANWIKTDTNYYISVSSSAGTNVLREPSTSTTNQNVKAAPPLQVVWVPVRYNGGPTPSMTPTDREALLKSTREYWPIVDINQSVRSGTYNFNQALEGENAGPGWQNLLSEIRTLKISDGAGSNVYYHAIVDNDAFLFGSGIYGIAYRPGTIAVSREHTETIAHEWGHNWGRRHVAGCNNPSNPDPNYPHSGASIGVWGINVFDNSLAIKPPSTWRDTMSYCDVDWSSDYNYDAIANYRSTGSDFIDNRVKQLVLMVSGTISANGQATLNPSFSLESLTGTVSVGAYTVQLLSLDDIILATMKFDSEEIDHSEDKHFFVNVPVTTEILTTLTKVRILDSNGIVVAERNNNLPLTQTLQTQSNPLVNIVNQNDSSLTLKWDNTRYPKIMVKNNTGIVIAIADSGVATVSLDDINGSVEVLLSDGVSSTSVRLEPSN